MRYRWAYWLNIAWGIGLLLTTPWAWAQTPEQAPFVVKRLFVPGGETAPAAPGAQTPIGEGRIVLTGVMMLPDGKRALLEMKRDPGPGKDGPSRAWWREGETVGGYVLETIESAAVVLAANQQKVRIPLYGTAKDRPQPTMTSSVMKRDASKAGQPAAGKNVTPGQQGSSAGGATGSKSGANPGVSSSPAPAEQTMEGLHQSGSAPQPGAPQGTEGAPSAGNPFLEALRKAREAQGESPEPLPAGAPTVPNR